MIGDLAQVKAGLKAVRDEILRQIKDRTTATDRESPLDMRDVPRQAIVKWQKAVLEHRANVVAGPDDGTPRIQETIEEITFSVPIHKDEE